MRFERREFASFPFTTEPLMRRHEAFRSADELRRFLEHDPPRHLYYSAAYYQRPDRPSMEAKEWLGADVIFDLDADHLRGAGARSYAEQLVRVKEQLQRLLDDFVFGDFGVDPSEVQVVFSGGRGYHVHLRDERFLPLTSAERRELVEYVTGAGFNPAAGAGRSASRSAPSGEAAAGWRAFPGVNEPGWKGRRSRGLLELLARWEREGKPVVERELTASGLPPEVAATCARSLLDRGRAEQIRSRQSFAVFKARPPEGLIDALWTCGALEAQGETDAPVTTDVHRLIRLPGSLHGGSGLRVMTVAPAELPRFEPLRDATPRFAENGHETEVELLEPVDHPFGKGRLQGAAGDRRSVPTAAAVFLVLRGEARLPP
ncbi:MAG: DNA primase small subunit PriS [Thermoplasmata archaeon]|nr:DNA primase small subunit PriS [Thermoplasmata archaeon]